MGEEHSPGAFGKRRCLLCPPPHSPYPLVSPHPGPSLVPPFTCSNLLVNKDFCSQRLAAFLEPHQQPGEERGGWRKWSTSTSEQTRCLEKIREEIRRGRLTGGGGGGREGTAKSGKIFKARKRTVPGLEKGIRNEF